MFASLKRACSRVLGGAVLVALLVSACGGGDSADPSSSSSKATVAGADGASVTFDERNVAAKSGRTVRVARNASGAPQLPPNAVPVGGIYEFTPLGLIAPGVEIRVPFNADALPGGTRPQLLVAAPGEPWTQVRAARVEGAAMVARVHRLTHAVVVAVPEVRSGGLFKQAFGSGSDNYSPLVQVAVASSSPALPAPDAEGVVPVTQPTTMTLRATYELPAQCTERRQITVAVHGIELDANGEQVGESASVLAEFLATSPSGELSVPYEFAAGHRGVYFTMIRAVCINGIEFTFAGINGFVFQVDTTASPAPAPVISVAPQDRSVIEGDTATFAVEATGTNLAYQWQRSNDGGQTYSPVAGTGASLSFVASLAHHGSLWRVLVSNDAGTTTSTPGLLSVAQRVVAPAVTSDPSNQTVLEGETASFTVVGTGTPAPAIEWQVRSAAVADPEAGWSVVAGATASTYTTAATTLSQSGAQYRAVLRNAGGTAASLPATLTVQRQVVAPAIVSAPQSQSVQESQFGAFTVSASGTTPLSYQWFRNGQAIVGATASEVLVYADPNDVGSTYQVTVQVSNAAGSVTSPAALMTVTAIPGTPVSAATGGTVSGPNGSSIQIPANALGQDVSVTLRTIAAAGVPAPTGFEALGDAIDVQPASLSLSVDGVLALPVPDTLPEGRALALLEFDSTSTSSGKLAQWFSGKGNVSSARPVVVQGTNLRRLAASGGTVSAAAAVSGTPRVTCVSPQAIVDGLMNVLFKNGGLKQVGTVGMESCGGYVPLPPSGGVPSTSQLSCGNDEAMYPTQPNNVSEPEYLSLKNRHVSCDRFVADVVVVEENRSVPDSFRFLGNAQVQVMRSIHGKPTSFMKTYEFHFKTLSWTVDPSNTNNRNPSVKLGVQINCSTDPSWAKCSAENKQTSLVMSVGRTATLSVDVTHSVADVPQGTMPLAYFYPNTHFVYSVSGDPYHTDFSQVLNLSVGVPRLRCDDKVAHESYPGCVFDRAAAVLVLDRSTASVAEAAEHIWEAQNNGSPGRFMLMPGTPAIADSSVRGDGALLRARWEATQTLNRDASCRAPDSLFNTRQPQRASTACEAGTVECSCDEYPFASTYNGGAFDPARTSVKLINHRQNMSAGSGRISSFYGREHVVDLAQFPGDDSRGDEFWVHIK